MGFLMFFNVILSFVQIVFYTLGILCFLKYLQK